MKFNLIGSCLLDFTLDVQRNGYVMMMKNAFESLKIPKTSTHIIRKVRADSFVDNMELYGRDQPATHCLAKRYSPLIQAT